MEIAALVISILGIFATILVGWLVYIKTDRILSRINSVLIARIAPAEFSAMDRLIEDIERTGEKRGTVVQRPDGTWSIDWTMNLQGKLNLKGVLGKQLHQK
jgi:hypothetical protein